MQMRMVWLACSVAACVSSGDDGRDDDFIGGGGGGKEDGALSEGSPEARGVLAVVNTLAADALDGDVGLDRRAATGITSHRGGDPFDTLAELDAIPYVGPIAFGKLLEYAQAHGFITHALPTIALPDDGPKTSQSWACGITGGSLECWGRNWYGTLGNGRADVFDGTVYAPQAVPGLAGVTSVAGGSRFVVALAGGDVYWWGNDPFAAINSASPTKVSGLSGAKAITTGSAHACALLADDTVSCWGHNADGALGDGTTKSRATPAVVPGLTNVAAIAAGGYHTCALSKTGAVSCWGENQYDQVGEGDAKVLSPQVVAEVTDATAIAAGGVHTCALKSNGKVVCWGGIFDAAGNNGDFYPIADVTHAVALSAGYAHTCALEASGDVVCWGWGGLGQTGQSTAGCAWDSNGLCPKKNGYGRVVPEVHGAVEISAKGGSTCARAADGHVTCFGSVAESLASRLFQTW